MLYCSERNTGCRFTEITLQGMRALVLQNEKLHITVLLDHGADIIEFAYKPTDTDFVWRNPMGFSSIKKLQMAPVDSEIFADNYLGGFFEIAPSIGGSGRYEGITFGGYCESNQLPWEYAVECDTSECITLRCFVRLNKLPVQLDRRMTLRTGVAALEMKETMTNLGRTAIPYQWGWHPNIGGGFLNEHCVVEMDPGEMRVMRPSARFGSYATGYWPMLTDPDTGAAVNYSEMLAPGTMLDELVDVQIAGEGWAAVRDTEKGLGIALSWEKDAFPYAAVWESCCHREGNFRLGGAYVMCFLLRSQRTMGLPAAVEENSARWLDGMQSTDTRLTLSVFEGKKEVKGVNADGSVFFR